MGFMNSEALLDLERRADAVLVENARSKGVDNLFFIGVMSTSENSNILFNEYVKHGADAIINDVNDIPYIFTNLESV